MRTARWSGEVTGAVADLGVLVPLAAALILVNGLHPAPLLATAGALSLAAGLWFRVPFPVQPLKALTALAVAQRLPAETIHAAGLLIGVILLAVGSSGLADRVAAWFTKPVIRSLQLAVGALLVRAAYRLAAEPPEVFAVAAGGGWVPVAAAATALLVALAAWRRRYGVVLAVLAAGVAMAWLAGTPGVAAPAASGWSPALPSPAVWGSAFVLLVVPQLPLTYGNAVVGMADLARERFPDAHRVRAGAVAVSCGLGNVAAALVGGMPMCHGSSGFTAHVRLGARTAAMNVLLGGTLLGLGLLLPGQVLALFALLPVWALAGLLAYAGARHAMLVLDLQGRVLAVAVAAAAVGTVTGNLALTTALALGAEWLPRLRARVLAA